MVVWRSLEEIGLSQKTIVQEDIKFIQYGGLFPKSKLYSLFTLWNVTVACTAIPAMAISCFLRGDFIFALEAIHLTLIGLNMTVQFSVFHYYSDITTKLYRAINENFFNYGDTMDDLTHQSIHQANEIKNKRKQILAKTFKLTIYVCAGGVAIKRPLLYLYNGHGKEDSDGKNWILYESPTGMYIPFSDHWLPYIYGMVQSYTVVWTIMFIAASSVSCFLRFGEELLHQLYIIKIGLRNATQRADHLYYVKFGKREDSLINKAEYEICLKECLNASVKHHHIIIELFEDFKRLMYVPLFTVIFDGGALICLATLVLMTTDNLGVKMMMASFMVGELYYTYVYCGYGDRLTREFSEIGDQLYLIDFLDHSMFLKAYLVIIHAHSLRPKRLSAAGFTSPNFQSFGSVLRTAYSLMNFVLTQQ